MKKLPAIHTIPPGLSFGRELAAGLLTHYRDDLLALSDVHLYLPDRRAIRAVREAFLAVSDGQATLLPQMFSIGDSNEEELLAVDPFALGDDPTLTPAIDPLERQMILMDLVRARRDIDLTPAQAFALAGDLARLLDQAITDDVSLDKLPGLVTGELAAHWQKTMDFLEIIQDIWPKYLKEKRLWDASYRRKIVLEKKIDGLRRLQPKNRIIAAGAVGLTAQTSELLRVIAGLPDGCVILPGFDPDYPHHYWEQIDAAHPYFHAKQFLGGLDYEPKNVTWWPLLTTGQAQHPSRRQLIHHALQPMNDYDLSTAKLPDGNLGNLRFCETETGQHEAKSIALVLREVLETKGKTALVVTPDRGLAQRIGHEMQRWEIILNDSGGYKLLQAPIAGFFRLILSFCDTERPVATLLSLMRHPLFNLSPDQTDKIGVLDIKYLRGAFSVERLFGMELPDAETALQDFFNVARAPLYFTQNPQPQSLYNWLTQHIEAAEILSGGADSLWRGDAADALAQHLIALRQLPQSADLQLTAQEYREFMDYALGTVTVRPTHDTHPRLRVVSPAEALMQDADLVILAGLNEKIWPPQPPGDPWLSQPMRRSVGFTDAQARMGQSALKFMNLFCAPDIMVSWSKEREGSPALPSRWLLQIFAVMEKNGLKREDYMQPACIWAQGLDRPSKLQPRTAPAPVPPLELRPKKLSLTEIRNWFNDPYSLFVKRILDLEPLDPIDHTIGAREWGTIIHEIIEKFLPRVDEADPLAVFNRIAENELALYSIDPLQKMRWQQQLARIGQELLAVYQGQTAKSYGELPGHITRAIDGTDITIHGRADLISIEADRVTVTDFKTGTLSGEKDILAAKDPQLALLGLIAREGGFDGLKAADVDRLQYIGIKGRHDRVFEEKVFDNPDTLIEANADKLMEMLVAFYRDKAPYHAEQAAGARYDTYEHLKRAAEWALPQEEEEEA
jgi:ATP-dependent helicase/nuclease subunit B